MPRCQQVFFINDAERERCDQEATHYCANCDKELCASSARECRSLDCEAKEGLRPKTK